MSVQDGRAQVRTSAGIAARVPSKSARRGLTRATGTFYAGAGALAFIAMRFSHPDGVREIALNSIALFAALIVGPALFRWGDHWPRIAYHGLVLGGTAIITAVVLLAGQGPASIGLAAMYYFVVIDAGFFFTWRGVLFQTVMMETAALISMRIVDMNWSTIIMLQGCGLISGLIIAWLARVAYAAEEDNLTRLPNARGLDFQLGESIANAEASHGDLALISLDIDDFKGINREYGMSYGDRVLLRSVDRWMRHLVAGQVLARTGADHFVVVLPGMSLAHAGDLADTLRTAMPEGVTVCAGVASWREGDSVSVLTARASSAVYQAKQIGRDATVVHGDLERGASVLEAAIANGEMQLYYQPVVSLADNKPVSAEMLVRWNDPKKGLVGPVEFVPRAEATGAIHALGDWTLREACRLAVAHWADLGLLSLSVNVSVHELRRADYTAKLKDVLSETGIDPSMLIVEVTEGVFDHHDIQITKTLNEIREAGVRVSIDDFGSGYSSLRWLENLPSDILKIDAAFVWAIPEDSYDAPVLEAVITMAKALGKRCVAEGIETEHQANVLRYLGCELGQGYLFARPAPVGLRAAA